MIFPIYVTAVLIAICSGRLAFLSDITVESWLDQVYFDKNDVVDVTSSSSASLRPIGTCNSLNLECLPIIYASLTDTLRFGFVDGTSVLAKMKQFFKEKPPYSINIDNSIFPIGNNEEPVTWYINDKHFYIEPFGKNLSALIDSMSAIEFTLFVSACTTQDNMKSSITLDESGKTATGDDGLLFDNDFAYSVVDPISRYDKLGYQEMRDINDTDHVRQRRDKFPSFLEPELSLPCTCGDDCLHEDGVGISSKDYRGDVQVADIWKNFFGDYHEFFDFKVPILETMFATEYGNTNQFLQSNTTIEKSRNLINAIRAIWIYERAISLKRDMPQPGVVNRFGWDSRYEYLDMLGPSNWLLKIFPLLNRRETTVTSQKIGQALSNVTGWLDTSNNSTLIHSALSNLVALGRYTPSRHTFHDAVAYLYENLILTPVKLYSWTVNAVEDLIATVVGEHYIINDLTASTTTVRQTSNQADSERKIDPDGDGNIISVAKKILGNGVDTYQQQLLSAKYSPFKITLTPDSGFKIPDEMKINKNMSNHELKVTLKNVDVNTGAITGRYAEVSFNHHVSFDRIRFTRSCNSQSVAVYSLNGQGRMSEECIQNLIDGKNINSCALDANVSIDVIPATGYAGIVNKRPKRYHQIVIINSLYNQKVDRIACALKIDQISIGTSILVPILNTEAINRIMNYEPENPHDFQAVYDMISDGASVNPRDILENMRISDLVNAELAHGYEQIWATHPESKKGIHITLALNSGQSSKEGEGTQPSGSRDSGECNGEASCIQAIRRRKYEQDHKADGSMFAHMTWNEMTTAKLGNPDHYEMVELSDGYIINSDTRPLASSIGMSISDHYPESNWVSALECINKGLIPRYAVKKGYTSVYEIDHYNYRASNSDYNVLTKTVLDNYIRSMDTAVE